MFWDFDRLAVPIYRSRAQRFGIRNFTQAIMEMYWAEGNMAVDRVVAYAPQAGFGLEAYPAIGAWMKRMEALPGFIASDGLPKASRP